MTMHVVVRDKNGTTTLAFFTRSTMSRTLRRYPATEYEYVSYELSAEPIRLSGMHKTLPTMPTAMGRNVRKALPSNSSAF